MFKVYETTKITVPLQVDHRFNGDIGDFCFISAKLDIEDKIHIADHCSLTGKGSIHLEEGVTIGPHCTLYTSMPDKEKNGRNKYTENHKSIVSDIYIGKNAFIGANSVIGCGAKIEDNVWLPPFSHVKPYEVIKNE